MEKFPGKIIRDAYHKAPAVIQEFHGSDEMTAVATRLQQKYSLHVDVAGEIERGIGYLLIGLISPMEFLGRLVAGGVDGATAQKIVEDVNKEIFAPLHEKMRSGGSVRDEEGTKVAPVTQPVPQVSYKPEPLPVPSLAEPFMAAAVDEPLLPVGKPEPSPAPVAAPPTPPPTAPSWTPPSISAMPQAAPAPAPEPEISRPVAPAPISDPVVAPLQAAPMPVNVISQMRAAPVHPPMRTMAHDMQALHDGVAPLPYESTIMTTERTPVPLAAVPAQPAPQPEPVAPSIDPLARTIPPRESAGFRAPPPNLPGTGPLPVRKNYSVDPYREPVE